MTLQAGIHKGVPMADYIRDPAPEPSLSTSSAETIITRSCRHVWYENPRLNPAWTMRQNSMMDAGSIAHALLLDGDERKIVVCPFDDWRKNAAKEMRDAAWAQGQIPVLESKMETCRTMAAAARVYLADSELAGIFERGTAEQTLIWQHDIIWLRSRPDFITDDHAFIIDYKSTGTSAEPNAFAKQIGFMGYDLQAAIALQGLKALANATAKFVFLVQENEPPYLCSLVGISEANLDVANRKLDFAMTLWANCIKTNNWKGYPPNICWAEPLPWQEAQFEERRNLDAMLDIAAQA